MRKYRNKKTIISGITFDSALEARRYSELALLQKSGHIRNLERQYPIELKVNGVLVCKMLVDFHYFEGNEGCLEEIKSKPTMTPTWRLKVRLLRALFPGIVYRVWPPVVRKARKRKS